MASASGTFHSSPPPPSQIVTTLNNAMNATSTSPTPELAPAPIGPRPSQIILATPTPIDHRPSQIVPATPEPLSEGSSPDLVLAPADRHLPQIVLATLGSLSGKNVSAVLTGDTPDSSSITKSSSSPDSPALPAKKTRGPFPFK